MAQFGTSVADTAWAVLAQVGALEPCTFTSIPAPVRNLDTGQTTAAGVAYNVDMLVRSYRRAELEGAAIVAGDLLARIPYASLEVTPTTRDTVTYANVVWSVVAVTSGANNAWWRLTLRRARPV